MKTESVIELSSTDAAPPRLEEAPAPAPRTPKPRRRPPRSGIRSVLKHLVLIAVSLIMIYPLLWMIVSSLRPDELIFRDPGLWLQTLEFSNYELGWNALDHPFSHYMLNSAIVVLGSILGNLISCSMAAYAFARMQFRGNRLFFGIMLLTIMLPIHVIIVPQYIMFSQIGWVNTFWPLIAPKLLATDAFFVFLMVQFIRGIPKDLDEAARIDGAGHARIFLQIILPLMVPALATTTIFTFIWTWSDFFTSLIFLTSPNMFTVPVALRTFVDSEGATSWGSLFAMSVVSLLPVFIAFLFGQRFLIKGIGTTGLK
jgi:multiple sugar transport system permease protein